MKCNENSLVLKSKRLTKALVFNYMCVCLLEFFLSLKIFVYKFIYFHLDYFVD